MQDYQEIQLFVRHLNSASSMQTRFEKVRQYLAYTDPHAAPSPRTTRGRRRKRAPLSGTGDGLQRLASSATPDTAQTWKTDTCQNTSDLLHQRDTLT